MEVRGGPRPWETFLNKEFKRMASGRQTSDKRVMLPRPEAPTHPGARMPGSCVCPFTR